MRVRAILPLMALILVACLGPASGQGRTALIGHTDSVYSVAWSPDGQQLASGSLDNTIIIWDVASVK
jgi:WD40 repeat protein